MRYFVIQSIKRRRVSAFSQNYNSKLCDDISKIISEELNVKRNSYQIIEAYLNYKNKQFKIIEKNMKMNLKIIEMRM